MGFCLQLIMELPIDVESGRPCSLEPIATVPFQYLRFVNQYGPFFSCYVNAIDGKRATPQELLNHYPRWEDVVEEVVARGHSWKEMDHTAFREALRWFSDFSYYAFHWSY